MSEGFGVLLEGVSAGYEVNETLAAAGIKSDSCL